MEKASKLLTQLQELEFAAIEVKLYLDNHPHDQRAQHEFQRLTYQIMMLTPKVEKYYGPIKQYGYTQENPARWISEPWPWELTY